MKKNVEMTRKNERLIDCIPYKASDGSWYMRLIYGYEDEKGKHEVVFPKVQLPVATATIPFPTRVRLQGDWPSFISDVCSIPGLDSIPIYEDTWDGAVVRGVKEAACVFDIVTDPAVQELTVEEIEKRLGYKVKIVGKENDK